MTTLRVELLRLREAIGARAGLRGANLSELLKEPDPRRAYLRALRRSQPQVHAPLARGGFLIAAVLVGGGALLPVVRGVLLIPIEIPAATLLLLAMGAIVGRFIRRRRV